MDTVRIRQLREPFRKEPDIETELHGRLINALFLDGQQVDQQRRQAGLMENIRHKPIARAQVAAAAAMGEHDEPLRVIRDGEIPDKIGIPEHNLNAAFFDAVARRPRIARACVHKSPYPVWA